MAAQPGEDLAATLFADVHYFYGPPSAKPPHHRFDKGSYVYLFENAGQRRARIEIANNAGTPEQDAFNGHLDSAHIQYSYRHTTLVTLAVDGQSGLRSPPPPVDTQEWLLPTFDPKNENKYRYRLHSLDIYFWTKEDALSFVNGIRRVLPQHQITIQDEPVAPAHADAMSPVVQKLEDVAITDPSYQQGHTRDSRSTTASFPGPPISALPNSQEASNFSPPGFKPTPPPAQPAVFEPAAFAPLAYNPAAPAAPEAIQHREKTPPPEDGAANPLVAAAASEHGQRYGVPFHQPGGFSGPPQSQPQQGYFPGPPGPPSAPPPVSQPSAIQSPYAQHFQNQFAPPPTAPSNIPAPPAYKAQPSPHIPVTQFATYPASPSASSGKTTPGIYSPGLQSTQPTPAFSPPVSSPTGGYAPGVPPPGGFAQYNYVQRTTITPMSNTQPLMTDCSIHQQIYRPTENEASTRHHEKPPKAPTGKLEQRAGQLERGMTGLFKKLEKRIG